MKKRVFIYVRVSTTEQAEEGYSLGEQEDRLRKYCEAMEWEVVAVYIDGGYTGSNMERPQLQSMIKEIEKGKADIVLVDKLDRLSRSQFDTLYMIQKIFNANNVAFVSRAEAFDTSSSFGRAMVGILAVFAELERERIKERMKEGKAGRAKEGKWHGGGFIPIGYVYDSETGGLQVDEYEAMQVREIFKLFNERTPVFQIMKIMNAKGYRTKYGDWREKTIRSVCANKVYIGILVYKGEEYEGLHKPIITNEEFEKAAHILEERDRMNEKYKVGKKYKSPLGGIMYCKNCGAKYMWKHNGKNKDGTFRSYYTCYSRSKSDPKMVRDVNCKNKTYRDYKLEDIVYKEIRKLKNEPEYLDTIQNSVDNSEKMEMIKKRISEISKQISRFMDLYSLNAISMEEINAKVDPLATERKSLETQLEVLESEAQPVPKSHILSLVDLFEDALASNDTYGLNRAINELIDHIEIDGSNIEIHWNFNI